MSLEKALGQLNRNSQAIGLAQCIRQNGYEYFAKKGIPTPKDEDWKYTSLKSLELKQLEPRKGTLNVGQIKNKIKEVADTQFFNLIFVNGIFDSKLSELPANMEVQILNNTLGSSAFGKLISPFRKARKRAAPVRQDALEALNSAFMQNGIVLKVFKGKKIAKPVQLIFLQTGQSSSYVKTFIHLKKSSSFSLIETHLGGGDQSFANSVTEIILEAESDFKYLRSQNLSGGTIDIGCTRIFAEEKSQLESLVSSLGGEISRHNLDFFALGPGAVARINGLTLTAGKQHVDNHTNIEHVVGHCETHQLYKSILAGSSRAVFNGRVHIRRDAQKANSDQLNQNLLLTSHAEADSKPQLEIYADDVKATHGSTVGQLDAEELFYFLSRGISKEQAQEMLSLGFIQDVVERISEPSVRGWMRKKIKARYLALKELL